MIQRIQSIFLLLAAAGFGSLFFVPIAKSNKGFGEIYANQALDVQDHIGLIGLTAGGAILALISIFLFNNRKLQVAMSSFAAILVLPLIGLSYFLFSGNATDSMATTSLSAGFFLPIASFVMCLLAVSFIRKDEKLVKSMDRLR